MAPHNSPDEALERFPSPEALESLRSAISRYLQRPSSEDELCASIDRLADDARAQGVHAERVLIAFKEAWRDASEEGSNPQHDRADQLARLATLCIDRYYRNL